MFSKYIKSGRKRCLFVPGETSVAVVFDQDKIKRILPHRAPFLLIDRIDQVDLKEKSIRGYRNIDFGDPVFKGHFPGQPVYPGALLMEIIGQLGICLSYLLKEQRTFINEEDQPKNLRVIKVREVSFIDVVNPGDKLTVVAKSLEETDFISTNIGQVLHENQVKVLALYEIYWLD